MCISAICRPAKNVSAPFYSPREPHRPLRLSPPPFHRMSSPATSMLAIHHLQPPLPAPLIGGRARRATSKREEASSLERTAQNTLSRCHGRSRRCRHRIRRSPDCQLVILLVIVGTLPYSRTTVDQQQSFDLVGLYDRICRSTWITFFLNSTVATWTKFEKSTINSVVCYRDFLKADDNWWWNARWDIHASSAH